MFETLTAHHERQPTPVKTLGVEIVKPPQIGFHCRSIRTNFAREFARADASIHRLLHATSWQRPHVQGMPSAFLPIHSRDGDLLMAAPRPQTIKTDLAKQIEVWLLTASRYLEPDSLEFKIFHRSAEKLALADGHAGSVMRALVFQLSGDVDSAKHWISNARRWPTDVEATRILPVVLSNLGYFGEASDALTLVPDEDVALDQSWFATQIIISAGFSSWPRLAGSAYLTTEAGVEDAELLRRCGMSLAHNGVSQAQVQAMLDVAGEVLRRHRRFFAGSRPVVRAVNDGVLYQLALSDASLSEIDAMTDEVIHALVDRSLDTPGLAFSFIPA